MMIFVLFRNKENEQTLSRKLSKVFSNFSLDKLSSCSCFSCNIFESVNYRTENKNHLADALFAFLFYLISQKLDCLMQLIIFLNHLFVIRVELIVFSFEILFRFLNQFHTNRSMMFVCSFFFYFHLIQVYVQPFEYRFHICLEILRINSAIVKLYDL